ncbi:MAG: 4Fe-4S binding protein [Ignavibacteria bacterium]
MKEKKKYIRNTEKPVQKYRFFVQSAFVLLCLWIGSEFYLFIGDLQINSAAADFQRPPGVDGFLPISSLMSFYLFLKTGVVHSAHPAGVFIFLSIILMSFAFGKSFCSWLCPAGFISELIGDFGEKMMKKIFKTKKKLILPKWIDYPLRSLKYLMLGFLFYSVFFLLTDTAIKAFLDSPYNLTADIKMYYFFADISRTALIIIAALFILSIFLRNFWCRFLCPYGALLGILSILSPNKVKRNHVSCIDCGLCTKICPSNIKVDKVKTVLSDECTACMNCIDVCPVADTLELKWLLPKKKKINKNAVAIGVISIFTVITGIGMITGNWQNNITREEYLYLHKNIHTFGHPTGTEAVKEFNKDSDKKFKAEQDVIKDSDKRNLILNENPKTKN